MSRGGRGGARGGGRKGEPDMAWEDVDDTQPVPVNRPPPTFPRLDLPVPRPLDKREIASVDRYLSFRERTRNGPYYATLNLSNLTDDKGKVDKRAGFDPFNDQDGYRSKLKKQKRTEPDLSVKEYPLQFFPKELWPLLDPKRRNPLWKTLDENDKLTPRKRKRKLKLVQHTEEEPRKHAEEDGREQDSGEDSDPVVTGKRQSNAAKAQKKGPATKTSNQKRGLDAEDDYPDDQNDDEDREDDDDPEDSEFDEDDEVADDYNAEQYFEDGEGDDFGDDGGNEGGDEGYY